MCIDLFIAYIYNRTLKFQNAMFIGARVALQSFEQFCAPVLPINAARDLDSDCSLPFLSVFTDPVYMSRKIRMFRTDKCDT